jgi:hypothetical protein
VDLQLPCLITRVLKKWYNMIAHDVEHDVILGRETVTSQQVFEAKFYWSVVTFRSWESRFGWAFETQSTHGGFLKWRYPKMDGFWSNILIKWMIWGTPWYPFFRKPPNESSENQITLIFLTTVVKVEKQDKITTPAVASHFWATWSCGDGSKPIITIFGG